MTLPTGTYADDKDRVRCDECKTGVVVRVDGMARCACGVIAVEWSAPKLSLPPEQWDDYTRE